MNTAQRILLLALTSLVLGGGHSGACPQPEITTAELRQHVEYLTSPELRGRKLGTRGAEQAESYIVDAMRAYGLKPLGDQGGYCQEFAVRKNGAKGHNVIGMIEGSDPALREQVVVVGAHHDHVGMVRKPGETGEGTLYPGADDNASGVSGLLELAQYFASRKASLKRGMVFVAFGGEEAGLLGSRHYVAHPPIPLAGTVAMVNLDMIGRFDGHTLMIAGANSSPDLVALARQCDTVAGFELQFVDVHRGCPLLSDHASFTGRKIPALDLFTGVHDDMHKPSDTADKLNFEGLARVVEYARCIVQRLDQGAEPPEFPAN